MISSRLPIQMEAVSYVLDSLCQRGPLRFSYKLCWHDLPITLLPEVPRHSPSVICKSTQSTCSSWLLESQKFSFVNNFQVIRVIQNEINGKFIVKYFEHEKFLNCSVYWTHRKHCIQFEKQWDFLKELTSKIADLSTEQEEAEEKYVPKRGRWVKIPVSSTISKNKPSLKGATLASFWSNKH